METNLDGERVQALIDLRRYAEARSLLGAFLSTHPTDGDALCLLAVCGWGERAWPEMLAAAERACVAQPDESWGHRLRAMALLQLDRPEETVRAAETAIRLDRDGWAGHMLLAGGLAQLPGSGKAAMTAMREAVRLGPNEADAHHMLGVLFHAKGRLLTAKRCYLRALRCDPQHSSAIENLGRIAERRSQLGTAMRLFSAAAVSDPSAVDGVAHARRVLRQPLGMAYATAVVVAVVLVFAVFPLAWLAATGLAGGCLTWLWLVARRMPAPTRRTARALLRSDPSLVAMAWSTGIMLVVALGVGVTATLAGTARDSRDQGRVILLLLGVVLAVVMLTSITTVVTDRRAGRTWQSTVDAGDPWSAGGGERLHELFRLFVASCVVAAVLLPGIDPAPDRELRMALGLIAAAIYAWYFRRVRRQRGAVGPRWHRMARWAWLVLLGGLVNLCFAVAVSVLPDSRTVLLGALAIPSLVLISLAALIQGARLIARLRDR